MSYRVVYGSFHRDQPVKAKKPRSRGAVAAVIVAVLVFGAMTVRLRGLPWVKEFLLPGDPEVTAMALEGLVQDLREGDTFGEAVTAFCREIMEHGQ